MLLSRLLYPGELPGPLCELQRIGDMRGPLAQSVGVQVGIDGVEQRGELSTRAWACLK
ncbi:MAG TPA: hypothetical protein VMK12_20655 [Anaeromyxobacteraceae bacterium]|nr:hypothetical protein [Anaeromyxobacteraceae bacterium]